MNKLSKNEVIFCEIEFKIEDTGIGIPTDKLDKIFLAFEQVGHNNFKAQGTGLGLAISQKMAHLIGGNIGVASELNQGSIFTLNLTVPCDFNLNSSYCYFILNKILSFVKSNGFIVGNFSNRL